MLGFRSLKVMRPIKLRDAAYAAALIIITTGKVNANVNYEVQSGAKVAVSEVTKVVAATIKARPRRLTNVKITLKSLRSGYRFAAKSVDSDSDSHSDSGSLRLIALEAQHENPDRLQAMKTNLNDDGLRW